MKIVQTTKYNKKAMIRRESIALTDELTRLNDAITFARQKEDEAPEGSQEKGKWYFRLLGLVKQRQDLREQIDPEHDYDF